MDLLKVEEVEKLEVHDDIYPPLDIAPEECYWHELTKFERQQLRPEERYIFSVIRGIDLKDKKVLLNSFGPRSDCLVAYLAGQKFWIDEAVGYLKINRGIESPRRSPELIEQVEKQIGPEYRLFILASYPALIQVNGDMSDEKARIIRKFCSSLRLAKRIFRERNKRELSDELE